MTVLCKGTVNGNVYEGKEIVDVSWNRETMTRVKLKPTGPEPGESWTEPVTGMKFVRVPKGCYMMGSNAGESHEKPVHKVCLDGFWMGRYEVTQGQWKKIMGQNPSFNKKGGDYPVEKVSWNDAKVFIKKMNRQSGNQFQLPSEAQWEYAARSGGRDQTYAGGENRDKLAWHGGNSGRRTHPVGTKAPNGLGIYDMSGNVWEWCEDVYIGNAYSNHEKKNPLVTSGGSDRVDRGGSWNSNPLYCRAAVRYRVGPGSTYSDLGFRLIRTD